MSAILITKIHGELFNVMFRPNDFLMSARRSQKEPESYTYLGPFVNERYRNIASARARYYTCRRSYHHRQLGTNIIIAHHHHGSDISKNETFFFSFAILSFLCCDLIYDLTRRIFKNRNNMHKIMRIRCSYTHYANDVYTMRDELIDFDSINRIRNRF